MIIAVPKYIRACYFPHNVTFANYSYFLWAPTLVYQINYPRAKKIRLRHIYVECVTTLHLTQNSATLVTFILSTGVYEYVIGCSLGLYKPILKAVFVIPSLLFIYITAFFRGWNGWNVFMWFVLFIASLQLAMMGRQ